MQCWNITRPGPRLCPGLAASAGALGPWREGTPWHAVHRTSRHVASLRLRRWAALSAAMQCWNITRPGPRLCPGLAASASALGPWREGTPWHAVHRTCRWNLLQSRERASSRVHRRGARQVQACTVAAVVRVAPAYEAPVRLLRRERVDSRVHRRGARQVQVCTVAAVGRVAPAHEGPVRLLRRERVEIRVHR